MQTGMNYKFKYNKANIMKNLNDEVNSNDFAIVHIGDDSIFYYVNIEDIGRITVLDGMTGFGRRDIESGFRDIDGRFWLASGNFDIIELENRPYIPCDYSEAIRQIKLFANNCIYLRDQYGK
jgi:hypothetical protein